MNNSYYGALALIPPLIAILLAIWKREVILSLLLGIFCGAFIINHYNPITALLETFSKYIVEKSLANAWNVGIITFCLAIGGMIGVMNRIGGTKAIADALARRAVDTRSTLLATTLLGLAIFFDDYANSMIVGNTMRPITDQHKISREKLAYIVDSTAAPVSSTCPISTWVAMELGLIASGLAALGIKGSSIIIFIETIPFRFYSLFALAFVFIIVLMGRDFGPMLKAEIRAKRRGQLFAPGSHPLIKEDKDLLPAHGVRGSIWDAVIPITAFALTTLIGLWYNGYSKNPKVNIREAIGQADASVVLTWAAFISSMVVISIGVFKRRFKVSEGIDAWVSGIKTMIMAVIILTLAFALKEVIKEMSLDQYLTAISKDFLKGPLLPVIVFAISFLMAFATGTSWGTDAILMPIVIPVAATISGATVSGEVTPLLISSIAAVLTGAVCGDHCSPISDTTILSSMASGSDHIDHVRTQLPYALTVALFSILFGYLPAGLGVSPWILLPAGVVAMVVFVRLVAKGQKGQKGQGCLLTPKR